MTEKIDLGKIRFNYLGTWNAATTYELNDVVQYGASSYVYSYGVASSGDIPDAGLKWSPLSLGTRWRGAFVPNTIYLTGDLVSSGASAYVALQATASATLPSADAANWGLAMAGSDQNVLKTGDVMSGPLVLAGLTTLGTELDGHGAVYRDLHVKSQIITQAMIVAGKVTVDISKGAAVVLDTPTTAVELTFTGFPTAGKVAYWELEVVAPGANAVTIKNTITWDGGNQPPIQAGALTTIISFRTRNAGAKIAGATSFGNLAA